MSNSDMMNGYDQMEDDDLTWLARNEHEWDSEYTYIFKRTYFDVDEPIADYVNDGSCYLYMGKFPLYTREQWQQRRAELQNKPSWDSISSDTNLIQQGLNGSWYGHHDLNAGELPIAINGTGWVYLGRDGKVLGDCRNTLEKRPECNCDGCTNGEEDKTIDMVNNPPHYQSDNGIECIEAIKAQLTPEEFRGYCKGNVVKYVWRERQKGRNESLNKAQWYLNQLTGIE